MRDLSTAMSWLVATEQCLTQGASAGGGGGGGGWNAAKPGGGGGANPAAGACHGGTLGAANRTPGNVSALRHPVVITQQIFSSPDGSLDRLTGEFL